MHSLMNFLIKQIVIKGDRVLRFAGLRNLIKQDFRFIEFLRIDGVGHKTMFFSWDWFRKLYRYVFFLIIGNDKNCFILFLGLEEKAKQKNSRL